MEQCEYAILENIRAGIRIERTVNYDDGACMWREEGINSQREHGQSGPLLAVYEQTSGLAYIERSQCNACVAAQSRYSNIALAQGYPLTQLATCAELRHTTNMITISSSTHYTPLSIKYVNKCTSNCSNNKFTINSTLCILLTRFYYMRQ